MSNSNAQPDPELFKSYLYSIIIKQPQKEGLDWLDQKLKELSNRFDDKTFHLIFSQVSRFIKKNKLLLSAADLKQANILRRGFNPSDWTKDQAVRVLLILHLPCQHISLYKKTLDGLFNIADVSELIALYSSLPLLPYPEEHRLRATEGLRSSMSVVFDAVALNNPYPADYLDEAAWNQMILKSIFINRPTSHIHDLDKRTNVKLATMLLDYAYERSAAGREVTPDLWRVVDLEKKIYNNEENDVY